MVAFQGRCVGEASTSAASAPLRGDLRSRCRLATRYPVSSVHPLQSIWNGRAGRFASCRLRARQQRVCSALLLGDLTPLPGEIAQLPADAQGEEIYNILAAPEVVVGTLIIVAGLAWLMGSILLWDYRERRTDNPEDEGYIITPTSRAPATMGNNQVKKAWDDAEWIGRMSVEFPDKVNDALMRKAVDNIMQDVSGARQMMVGLLNFTLLKAYLPRATSLQSKTLMDVLENPPAPGSRLPDPVRYLLKACGEVEAFEQTTILLDVLDGIGASRRANQRGKFSDW